MVETSTISSMSKQEIKDLLEEILATNLKETSKPAVKEIFETFSNLLDDVKNRNISLSKLKSMLGFFSEKQKK